jgi:hypothetical protein
MDSDRGAGRTAACMPVRQFILIAVYHMPCLFSWVLIYRVGPQATYRTVLSRVGKQAIATCHRQHGSIRPKLLPGLGVVLVAARPLPVRESALDRAAQDSGPRCIALRSAAHRLIAEAEYQSADCLVCPIAIPSTMVHIHTLDGNHSQDHSHIL